jgi:uncharacterized membrane protein
MASGPGNRAFNSAKSVSFWFDPSWTELLAKDYVDPRYHISFARAVGRRLRRTYAWIFVIQAIAYYGKLTRHR